MSFYIHLHDPSFFDAPWPGQRRLGPFNSSDEALEQAASDLVGGAGEGALGIYTEADSDAMRQDDVRMAHLLGQLVEELAPTDQAPRSDEFLVEHAQDREWVTSQLVGPDAVELEPAVTVDEIQARATEITTDLEQNLAQGTATLKAQMIATLPTDMPDDQKNEIVTEMMKMTRVIY